MPHTREGLKQLTLDIPRLAHDSPKQCPAKLSDIKRYVRDESASGTSSGMRWCRTADIDDVHYWVWELDEDGDLAYVYVELFEDSSLLGLDDADGMTFEQFLVWVYLRNQYDWK